MSKRTLGTHESGLKVSPLGLGCMGMSEFYGTTEDAVSLTVMARARELGIDFFDSADTYGTGHNEELIGRFIAERGKDFKIATKFGIVRNPGEYARTINNDPAYVREACEASLRRLGVEQIDLYYMHRVEDGRPIEEPMEALAALVAEGKIAHVGLCEVSPEMLRRACKVHPISALQSEYSLWTRGPEAEVLAACRELGVGFVPYSPLGRGFLTGAVTTLEGMDEKDFRRANPRFSDENMPANLELVARVREMAEEKGCSAAQLALAWVLAQGDDIVPIPGTKRVTYLEQNVGALHVVLTAEDLARLDEIMPTGAAAGDRYHAEGMKGVYS
ncbi:MAG: aldo/keto reductase [Pseudomonadota bacterium]